MRKIYVAVMAYAGALPVPVAKMLRDFEREAAARGWIVSGAASVGNCILPMARNAFVAEFLASDATDFLTIDCDNYTDAKTLVRIVEAPVECIGLAIMGRSDAHEWNVRWIADRPHLIAVDPATGEPSDTGFLEVDKVGTGILRLSRACLEKMVEAYKDEWYHDLGNRTGKAVALFEFVTRDHLVHGEDIIFCERWRAIGGQIWIDPTATTHHLGRTLHSGCIGSWLRSPNRGVNEINFEGLREIEASIAQLAKDLGTATGITPLAVPGLREAQQLAKQATG